MIKITYYIVVFILFPFVAIAKKDDGPLLEKLINNAHSYIKLPKKIFYISTTIKINSNKTIDGNGATFLFTPSTQQPVHLINISDAEQISLSNFTINSNRPKEKNFNYIHGTDNYLVSVKRSNKIKFNNLSFSNHPYTAVDIRNSKDVLINKCIFRNIGVNFQAFDTTFSYSFDGIHIASEDGISSTNISINNCNFKDIGLVNKSLHSEKPSSDDGDGIQLWCDGKSSLSDISISNCSFTNCARRGIKIQSGNSIYISGCSFTNIKSGIGLVAAQPVNDIFIQKNVFTNCYIGIAANGDSNQNVNNVNAIRNLFSQTTFTFRISGEVNATNWKILRNTSNKIGKCFFDGKIYQSNLAYNKINQFASNSDLDYYMAILLAPFSSNISISNNIFTTHSFTKTVIYLHPKVLNTVIANNKMSIPLTKNNKKYLIHFHDNEGSKEYANEVNFLNKK